MRTPLAIGSPLLRPVPRSVTILSQSKTKPGHRRIAGMTSCGGEGDASHNRVAVRWSRCVDRQRSVGAKRHASQPHPVRAGRFARAHRDAADRARDGGSSRQGRQLQELAFAVSDLHHGERFGHGERPLPRRYRHLQQHDLYRLFVRAGRRNRGSLHRERRGARRHRRAFQRRLSERGNHSEDGPRAGLLDRRHRQARPDLAVRPHRPWQEHDRDRRFPPAARTAFRCRTK